MECKIEQCSTLFPASLNLSKEKMYASFNKVVNIN